MVDFYEMAAIFVSISVLERHSVCSLLLIAEQSSMGLGVTVLFALLFFVNLFLNENSICSEYGYKFHFVLCIDYVLLNAV